MRAWFHGRSRREQLLVTGFVLLVALTWLVGAAGRLRSGLGVVRSTRNDLGTQQLWLDRRGTIEVRSAAAVRNLDPTRTYDATRLVATVNTLASGAGLSASIDPPQTQRTTQFAYHTVKVTFRRTTLPALLSFYDQLAKQAPYLNLESIALQTERSSAGLINATLQVSATQITR